MEGAAIDAAREQAERFLDDEDEDVQVWPENWAAVEVFTSCRWVTKVIAGMEGGARIYEGIEAGEISHCCDLLGIPKEERRDVLWGVRIMEQVAMPILNSR